MRALRLAPALLLCIAAVAQNTAPTYSSTGFLNACNLANGPFAPNTVVSIYGSGMAFSNYSLAASDIVGGNLPTNLSGVEVAVNNVPAPLYMVSSGQINFLMPTNLIAGTVAVRVIRQGLVGPEVDLAVQNAAPALFATPGAASYAIAQQWPQYSQIAPDTPTTPGSIVVLYASGLGRTSLYPSQSTEIPMYPGVLEAIQSFQVYLNGVPLDASKVLYAGICPGWSGLYQVNLILPEDVGPDPEIRLAVGTYISAPGMKLAVEVR